MASFFETDERTITDYEIKTLEHFQVINGNSTRGKGLLEAIKKKANAAKPVEG